MFTTATHAFVQLPVLHAMVFARSPETSMIRKLAVQNFKMLRDCAIDLTALHLIVGAGVCGKSTALDTLKLVSDVVRLGVSGAMAARGCRFDDLCFTVGRPIAIAMEIVSPQPGHPCVRYELELGPDPHADCGGRVARELLFIVARPQLFVEPLPVQPSLFGTSPGDSSLLHEKTPRGWRKAVAKSSEGKDYFWDERTDWHNMFRFGADRSALGSLPEDTDRFPASIALRDRLRSAVVAVALGDQALRTPAPPLTSTLLQPDGLGLPSALRCLQQSDPTRLPTVLELLRRAVPSLRDLKVHERPEDRYLVLQAQFEGRDTLVPSSMISSELLRLIALALLTEQSYGIETPTLLFDEPERGLGPRAIESAFDILCASRERQFVCATSSPMFVSRALREQVVALRRDDNGSAMMLAGEQLPDIARWFEP